MWVGKGTNMALSIKDPSVPPWRGFTPGCFAAALTCVSWCSVDASAGPRSATRCDRHTPNGHGLRRPATWSAVGLAAAVRSAAVFLPHPAHAGVSGAAPAEGCPGMHLIGILTR